MFENSYSGVSCLRDGRATASIHGSRRTPVPNRLKGKHMRTPNYRLTFALGAALLWAPAAFAAKNALYKCVDAAGVVSIQSESCPAGSTQAWRRDATPEPAPTPEQTAQAEARRQRDQQTVRELSEVVERKLQAASAEPAATAAAPADDAAARAEKASVDACQTAQAFAGAVREHAWLALTEDQTRRLYLWLAEQCKTPAAAD